MKTKLVTVREQAESVVSNDRNALYKSIFGIDSDASIQAQRLIILYDTLKSIEKQGDPENSAKAREALQKASEI